MWKANESIDIDAPPEAVWEVISDVARHKQLAGSGEIKAVRANGPMAAGATWEADESIKLMGSFTARSECLVFEPSSEFKWRSYPPPIKKNNPESVPDVTWSFKLEPSGQGTRLEHGFMAVEPRAGGLMMKIFYLLTRRAATVRKGMRQTLQNVKSTVESGSR